MITSKPLRRLAFAGLLAAAALAAAPEAARAAPAGNLNVAMSTLSEATFLPWNGSTGRKMYLDAIYEYLAYLDPKTQELKPGLAEKWDMSPDGKVFTFQLRRGVQFNGGLGEMTAEDVKYSLERMIDPKAIAGPSSPMRRAIDKIEAPERYTVVLTLKQPDIEFVSGYLSNGLIAPIVSKKYLEEKGDDAANANPLGTGAFVLDEHKRGISIRLKAIPNADAHWRVKPDFATLTFLSVPEESTRVAMLRTGEADLAPINYDSVDSTKAAGLNILSVSDSWAPVVRFGGLVPKFPNAGVPWAKREVREALNYAVDKDAIIKGIFHGQARAVGMDFPAPEFADVKAYPYDPARARKLLADAGFPNGFELTLRTYTTAPGAELPSLGEAVALYWQAVGVRVKITPTDWPSVRGAWTTGKATDVAWVHRGLAFPSTVSGLEASVISESVFSSYATPETDKMVLEIKSELNSAKRAALAKQLGNKLRDEAAAVFIAWAHEPYGASKQVGAWPTVGASPTNFDLVTRAK